MSYSIEKIADARRRADIIVRKEADFHISDYIPGSVKDAWNGLQNAGKAGDFLGQATQWMGEHPYATAGGVGALALTGMNMATAYRRPGESAEEYRWRRLRETISSLLGGAALGAGARYLWDKVSDLEEANTVKGIAEAAAKGTDPASGEKFVNVVETYGGKPLKWLQTAAAANGLGSDVSARARAAMSPEQRALLGRLAAYAAANDPYLSADIEDETGQPLPNIDPKTLGGTVKLPAYGAKTPPPKNLQEAVAQKVVQKVDEAEENAYGGFGTGERSMSTGMGQAATAGGVLGAARGATKAKDPVQGVFWKRPNPGQNVTGSMTAVDKARQELMAVQEAVSRAKESGNIGDVDALHERQRDLNKLVQDLDAHANKIQDARSAEHEMRQLAIGGDGKPKPLLVEGERMRFGAGIGRKILPPSPSHALPPTSGIPAKLYDLRKRLGYRLMGVEETEVPGRAPVLEAPVIKTRRLRKKWLNEARKEREVLAGRVVNTLPVNDVATVTAGGRKFHQPGKKILHNTEAAELDRLGLRGKAVGPRLGVSEQLARELPHRGPRAIAGGAAGIGMGVAAQALLNAMSAATHGLRADEIGRTLSN